MKYYRKQDVLKMVRRMIRKRRQRDFAREIGISEPYLADILRGRRDPGDKLLAGLGLRREWVAVGKEQS